MGRCSSCGKWFLTGPSERCVWCDKVICGPCSTQIYWFQIKTRRKTTGNFPKYCVVGFCSRECYNQFGEKVLEYPTEDIETDIPNFKENRVRLWHAALLRALEGRQSEEDFQRAVRLDSKEDGCAGVVIPARDGKLFELGYEFEQKAFLSMAQNLEKCGRYSDAAKAFEKLKKFDAARKLRDRDRHILVKRTDVSVNLNALLKQVQDGGIVAVFRCPHCGGKLKVSKDTEAGDLRECRHCGTELKTLDVADFLNTVLS